MILFIVCLLTMHGFATFGVISIALTWFYNPETDSNLTLLLLVSVSALLEFVLFVYVTKEYLNS